MPKGGVVQATTAEKLLVVLLARLATSELDHGATRTQPRKMIDAGDILRSKDPSIGTAVELRRSIGAYRELFAASGQSTFLVAQEVKAFIDAMHAILALHRLDMSITLSNEQRRVIIELLEQTAGAYQWSYHHHGFSGQVAELHTQHVLALLDLVQRYANQLFGAPQRSVGAIHALAAPS
jgi:hypothetical protein